MKLFCILALACLLAGCTSPQDPPDHLIIADPTVTNWIGGVK